METIIERVEGNIKIVQFNKPRRKNAIDRDMYIRITKILHDSAVDSSIGMMVLTGTGDYYSSGNDLFAAAENLQDNILPVLKEYINAFINFPKLLVAIVNGPAVGVAVTTLALCDLVFASEDSFFYTPFTKLGIIAEGCSTFTFPRLIGDRKAVEMLIFSQKMSAKEALECGLVNYLYKPEEMQNKVWDKIIEVSQLPPHCVTTTKKLFRRTMQDELIRANEIEMEELHKIWSSQGFVDGINNFISSRNKKSKL